MRFIVHRPTPPLASYIDYLWISESDPGVRVEGTQFPEGGVTILFSIGPRQGLRESDRAIRWFHTAWISGERLHPLHLVAPEGARLCGIHFRPGGARPFVGVPMSELANRVIDLDLVWPEAPELLERLAGAPSVADRFRILEASLLRRLAAHLLTPRGPRVVHGAVERLRAGMPGTSVGLVARDLGVTSRHLLRSFAEHVGIGPKALHRVLRFQRLIRTLDAGAAPAWTRLAVQLGYFDQSHLIRDFAEFTGLTPSSYAALRSPDPNFASGDGSDAR
jgi:AraC-like DNA-binding protein